MSTSEREKKRDSYHHGDLRNALVNIGVAMLAEEGVEALSLRGLARRAGVSHNAPYQHFADKDALLAAIAEQGFGLLADAIESSQTDAGTDSFRERLIAAGQGYVRFAIEHPHHFRLMFGPQTHADYGSLSTAARASFDGLAAIVATTPVRRRWSYGWLCMVCPRCSSPGKSHPISSPVANRLRWRLDMSR